VTSTYDELVLVLRAAGCVFAEEEAHLLIEAVGEDVLPARGESPVGNAARATGRSGELDAMVARRVAGEPLEYILGWVEFCGLQLSIDPGVFVPRRRTEFLVETARRLSPDPAVVLDLCCGCGALGIALGMELSHVELHAVDLDPVAVECARENVGLADEVYVGDLYEPLPSSLRGRVDVLLANVPYVPTGEIAFLPPEARDHEPLSTLDGGADGQDVMRRVIAAAPEWLARGGRLLIETSAHQAPSALALLTEAGLWAAVTEDDEREATVIIGTRLHSV
jgi:release factor glutamine methyltransferase